MLRESKEVIIEYAKKYATQFIDGLNSSVTPFHAVEYFRSQLLENGFKEINEKY